MTRVKLARYTMIDDESWFVINEEVPLGTEYELLDKDLATLHCLKTGKKAHVLCFLLRGNGHIGWIPAQCFEVMK